MWKRGKLQALQKELKVKCLETTIAAQILLHKYPCYKTGTWINKIEKPIAVRTVAVSPHEVGQAIQLN